jgi:ubiquitin carboxyl-terminal hydrolase 14
VFPLCNEALQKSIKANRDAEQKAKEEALERGGSSAPKEVEGITSSSSSSSSAAEMNVDDEDAAALRAAMAMSMSGDAAAMPPQPPSAQTEVQATNPFGEHLPANFTGNYELFGVVTHKGRSADSGHYIGWVRQPALEDGSSSDLWWKFDDDVVSEVNTADILNLKGGGDWHTAYMNFYRSKV